ncbi:MAG: peptidyl-prolyl cis-trans isomerase [Gammaproteobacteria bacterium]|nr:peptidyl-prolyl cis-trans isomerase [Gammaproteobacteria bacterium]
MNILREPLFHFLAAGAVIFALYGAIGGEADDTHTITLSPGQVDRLQQVFAGQWRRPPTQDELNGLIDAHIEEEILYREAMALGLDADDTIVRRRLAQKMQFLIEDVAAPSEPTHAQLTDYFGEHRSQFQLPPVVTFTHIYFSSDRRADAEGDARAQLEDIAQAHDIERAPDRGDPFMLRHDYADITEAELGRLFGTPFAQSVFSLPESGWQGPVRSGYGFHLVRIVAKTTPPEPEFDAVKSDVRAAYLDEERRRLNGQVLDEIKARYTVVRAPVETAAP